MIILMLRFIEQNYLYLYYKLETIYIKIESKLLPYVYLERNKTRRSGFKIKFDYIDIKEKISMCKMLF